MKYEVSITYGSEYRQETIFTLLASVHFTFDPLAERIIADSYSSKPISLLNIKCL